MIKLNVKGLDKLITGYDNYTAKSPAIMARAMNRVGNQSWTAASVAIRKEYNIRARDLKKSVKFKRARATHLTHVFTFKAHSIPLLYFTATKDERSISEPKKGLRYKVKKKGGTKVLRGSFVNTSKTRKTKYALIRRDKSRYPIIPLTVISPTKMMLATKADDVYKKTFMQEFTKRYRHELLWMLGKKK